MTKRVMLFCAAAVLLAFICLGAALSYVLYTFKTAGPLKEPVVVFIEKGSGVRRIADILTSAGVIVHPRLFEAGVRFYGAARTLQAGEYEFLPEVSPKQVMKFLKNGITYQRSVTLAEGLTSVEMVAVLNKAPALTGVLDTVPPEGSLLPETYHYSRNESRKDVLARAGAAMTEALSTLWETRDKSLPLATMRQAVTLASIVEKETGVPAERGRVAGVFMNRLKRKMPLQSDPTVIYALTQGQKPLGRKLYFKDLKIESPYNTYVVSGLPPGPICNPGSASLKAVLQPEKHDYVYFVADGTGGHVFAETLKEHNENVARWRKIQNNSKHDTRN